MHSDKCGVADDDAISFEHRMADLTVRYRWPGYQHFIQSLMSTSSYGHMFDAPGRLRVAHATAEHAEPLRAQLKAVEEFEALSNHGRY